MITFTKNYSMYIVIPTKLFKTGSLWIQFSADTIDASDIGRSNHDSNSCQ